MSADANLLKKYVRNAIGKSKTEPSSCKVEDREIYKHEYNIV